MLDAQIVDRIGWTTLGLLPAGSMQRLVLVTLFGGMWCSGVSTNASELDPFDTPGRNAATTLTVAVPEAPEAEPQPVNPPQGRADFMGSLRGRVVFDGTPPARKKLAVDKDHVALEGKELFDESLIVGENGGVANVIVWLRDADVALPPVDEPPPPATLRIKQLRYDPHVLAITTGQKLVIENYDPVGTSPIFSTQANPPTNILLPRRSRKQHQFRNAEQMPIPIAASVHPWLKAYLLVRDNPYFAITDPDGRFEISDLPPGKRTFQFWHENAGYLKRKTGWPKGRLEVTIGERAKNLGKIDVTYEDFDLPRQE